MGMGVDTLKQPGREFHSLLDAMDGIAYIVDADGTILDVGQKSWTEFARQNGSADWNGRSMIGRSLFAMIDGPEVREIQRSLHERVYRGEGNHVTYEFRCDAPDAERHMRMSMCAIMDDDAVAGVLYQSQILSEVSRIPLPLFSSESRIARFNDYRDDQIAALCSYCNDVGWPVGAVRNEDRICISAYEYYRRGGPADVVVSHGVCPPCFERLITGE